MLPKAHLLAIAAALLQAATSAFVAPALKPKANGASRAFLGVRRGESRSVVHSAETRRQWQDSQRAPGSCKRTTRASTCMQAGEKNLFDCIREEDLDALRRYVDRGGPVHVADTLGDTSLLVAASTGNPEVVKVLCDAPDAAVNYPCFHGGETPLMTACRQGHLGVAEYLVNEAGANVNAVDHRGDTALSLAAFWGKLDCLKFLLSLPETNTEIRNIQSRRAGEDMQELMRDESNDEETVRLLTESRVERGITRL